MHEGVEVGKSVADGAAGTGEDDRDTGDGEVFGGGHVRVRVIRIIAGIGDGGGDGFAALGSANRRGRAGGSNGWLQLLARS